MTQKKKFTKTLASLFMAFSVLFPSPVFSVEKKSTLTVKNEKIKWYNYDKGFLEAKKQNKKIVIDFYTDWCVFCKDMEQVYSTKNISKIINKDFIPIKINCDSLETITYNGKKITEKEFANQMDIQSYPSTMFLDNNKNYLDDFSGYLDEKAFKKKLEGIIKLSSLNNDNNIKEIIEAISKNKLDIIKNLVNKKTNLNASVTISKTLKNVSPLFYAVEKGNIEIIKFLIEKGGNINSKNSEGVTILMKAVEKDNLDLVKFLIEKGADINSRDNYGWSSILFSNSKKITEYLISKGSKINSETDQGITPLIHAVFNENIELTKFLVKSGANINHETKKEISALIVSILKNNKEISEFLIENGANINSEIEYAKTPLFYALKYGRKEMTELLISKGAKYDLFEISQNLLN